MRLRIDAFGIEDASKLLRSRAVLQKRQNPIGIDRVWALPIEAAPLYGICD
jgi:hypothetical protein